MPNGYAVIQIKQTFETLKNDLVEVSLDVIDEEISFVVETDASDVAVSTTLNQSDRPVAFYSRCLVKAN